MGELKELNDREELFARRKRLDDLAKIRDKRDENQSGEDRKISEIKDAILTGKIQIPPELKDASLDELVEYVKNSSP
jgi:hypothetical protein